MNSIGPLKRNTIANFIGLAYTTIIGIIIFPLYLQHLGAEAFGLVGFFIVLQAWMQLLDMGMSPLLSRQAAHSCGQNVGFLELKKLLRSLELIILILALIVVLSIFVGSNWIANHWLNISSLASTDVAICVTLMGTIIGLRFFSTLYRSGIQGMENQVQLNIANIVLTTLKFVGSLLLLQYLTKYFVYFFIYQLVISIIELSIMATMFYRLMRFTDRVGIRLFWNTLKPVLPFVTGIAYTAGIWVLLTQLDKIILSSILPLSEYGYFVLVSVVAAGVLKISRPISQAILPRMTHLLSQGNEQEMLALYRNSTQLMAVIMMPLTGTIALFSTDLLFAWTGDRKAAEWAGQILYWVALGNGILAISAFQYYLQFAHGKLRMHVIYHTISAIIQIPLIIYVAFEYGALGVAIIWFSLRLIAFIIWTPIVHHKFSPGIHWAWLLKDVAPIFISTGVLLLFINNLGVDFERIGRLESIFALVGICLMLVIANVLVSSAGRDLISTTLNKTGA